METTTINEKFLKSNPDDLKIESTELLSVLVMMISDLEAATMKFHEVIGVNRMLSFKEF